MKGFLFRWGLIVSGVFAIFTGASQLLVGEKLDETARPVSAAQALDLTTRDNKQHYVQIEGQADLSQRVYRTVISRPEYVALDTGRQHVLDPFGSDAQELIGQTVSVTGTLDPRNAELQTIEYYEGETVEDGTLRGLRVFVPVMESAGRIVLMSPGFSSTDDPDYDQWLKRASFTGVLSRLEDIPENRPGLDSTGADVRSVFSSLGITLAPDATILFTDTDGTRRERYSYAPIVGAGNGVFVEIPPGDEPSGGTFTGMARSASVSSYDGFKDAVGGAMPGTFALVDLGTTAADINAAHSANATTALTMGAIMLAIGGFWVFLRRWASQKRVAFLAKELEDLDRINGQGAASMGRSRDAA